MRLVSKRNEKWDGKNFVFWSREEVWEFCCHVKCDRLTALKIILQDGCCYLGWNVIGTIFNCCFCCGFYSSVLFFIQDIWNIVITANFYKLSHSTKFPRYPLSTKQNSKTHLIKFLIKSTSNKSINFSFYPEAHTQ